MGQQQLLLLVLGIVIVGLAVVVGISAFSENRVKSNADAMVDDGLRIASEVQAWALKPAQFGGGNDPANTQGAFEDLTSLSDVGYDLVASGICEGYYQNINACWNLQKNSATEVALYGYNPDIKNRVEILITGTNADDIATEVLYEVDFDSGS